MKSVESTPASGDLHEEYERMLYVIKALGGGIWDFDVISGDLKCNRRWHEILGLDYETQQVRSVEQFKAYIHPEDVDRATKVDMDEVHRLIARDERYFIEFRIIHQDGSPRWIRSVASLIAGPDDAVRAIGCITNVTPLLVSQPASGHAAPLSGTETPAMASAPGKTQDEKKSPETLSDSEIECLRWVSFGKTAKETAIIMGKSPRTIEFHLNNAMKKLNAVNKVQAAFLAIQHNLLR